MSLGKNWRTTLFGTIAAVAQVIPAFGHVGKLTVPQTVAALATFFTGLFAKDHNVQ